MPIEVQNNLPAKKILENENIFMMDEHRAISQDIRSLQIAFKSNAFKRRNRSASLTKFIKYTSSCGNRLSDFKEARFYAGLRRLSY